MKNKIAIVFFNNMSNSIKRLFDIPNIDDVLYQFLTPYCNIKEILSLSVTEYDICFNYISTDNAVSTFRIASMAYKKFLNRLTTIMTSKSYTTEPVKCKEQSLFDTKTKQYHNEQVYNSIETILNKNICVIKFNKAGFSPLQSMTVGDYYIVEKTINDKDSKPVDTYSLLTHDKMSRSITEKDDAARIVVKQIMNDNPERFEEIPIISWIEENNLDKDEIMLMPVIKLGIPIKTVVHPLTGKLRYFSTVSYQQLKSGSVPNFETFKNKPGYLKLHGNSTFKKQTDEVTKSETKYNNDYTLNNDKQNIKIQTVKAYDIPQGSITYTGTIGGIEETEEQMEQRINNDVTYRNNHKAPDIKMNDDYLLL